MKKSMTEKLFLGTSGLILPYKNKSFYPEHLQDKSRLAVYGTIFNSLEVNSSFYKIPRAPTLQKWENEVPENFKFTFKLWKGITHNKALTFANEDVLQFMNAINAIEHKSGCLLVQLPPSADISQLPQLSLLLTTITEQNHCNKWRIAIEFRHNSWYIAQTYKMLDQHHAGVVFHDKLQGGMNIDETEAPFIYLRFHGPGGDYKGSYDDAYLEEYSHYCHEWLAANKEVYVYFNNTMGEAIKNVKILENSIIDLL